jgi:hypothetical protein
MCQTRLPCGGWSCTTVDRTCATSVCCLHKPKHKLFCLLLGCLFSLQRVYPSIKRSTPAADDAPSLRLSEPQAESAWYRKSFLKRSSVSYTEGSPTRCSVNEIASNCHPWVHRYPTLPCQRENPQEPLPLGKVACFDVRRKLLLLLPPCSTIVNPFWAAQQSQSPQSLMYRERSFW